MVVQAVLLQDSPVLLQHRAIVLVVVVAVRSRLRWLYRHGRATLLRMR